MVRVLFRVYVEIILGQFKGQFATEGIFRKLDIKTS